jgi:threonine/homoserine/homoserine lactone efflux protein
MPFKTGNIRCLISGKFNFQETMPKSLTKGILANALSPHPYLFWLSVGAPTMSKAISVGSVQTASDS